MRRYVVYRPDAGFADCVDLDELSLSGALPGQAVLVGRPGTGLLEDMSMVRLLGTDPFTAVMGCIDGTDPCIYANGWNVLVERGDLPYGLALRMLRPEMEQENVGRFRDAAERGRFSQSLYQTHTVSILPYLYDALGVPCLPKAIRFCHERGY